MIDIFNRFAEILFRLTCSATSVQIITHKIFHLPTKWICMGPTTREPRNMSNLINYSNKVVELCAVIQECVLNTLSCIFNSSTPMHYSKRNHPCQTVKGSDTIMQTLRKWCNELKDTFFKVLYFLSREIFFVELFLKIFLFPANPWQQGWFPI